MEVKIVWVTPNAEDLVAHIARVSNPSNQDNPEYARLIRYLINHNHWSPFEMVSMCLSIKTSRAIGAQILRHRSFSFQEFSQRYAPVQEIEPVELRRAGSKNRQSSTEIFNPIVELIPYDDFAATDGPAFWNEEVEADEAIAEHNRRCLELYQRLVDADVSTETARFVLPMATQTHLYMAGTLRSWIHYITLRTQEDTQKEHRIIADTIQKIFTQEFPVISEALEWGQPNGIGI